MDTIISNYITTIKKVRQIEKTPISTASDEQTYYPR